MSLSDWDPKRGAGKENKIAALCSHFLSYSSCLITFRLSSLPLPSPDKWLVTNNLQSATILLPVCDNTLARKLKLSFLERKCIERKTTCGQHLCIYRQASKHHHCPLLAGCSNAHQDPYWQMGHNLLLYIYEFGLSLELNGIFVSFFFFFFLPSVTVLSWWNVSFITTRPKNHVRTRFLHG